MTKRLVILLTGAADRSQASLELAYRYAATASALDVEVELHVIGPAVALLSRAALAQVGTTGPANPAVRLGSLKAAGVEVFVCSAALADAGMTPDDLPAEVDGVRGAAALLAAALAPDARLLSL